MVAAVESQESIAVCVESGRLFTGREIGKMVAPFTIFGFMVNNIVLYFHLGQIKGALQIGCIVQGFPQTELDISEEFEGSGFFGFVFQIHFPYFEGFIHGYKVSSGNVQAVPFSGYNRIAHAVAAQIIIQVLFHRHPCGGPDIAVFFPDVKITSITVHGSVVVAVPRDALFAGIHHETITAAGIG